MLTRGRKRYLSELSNDIDESELESENQSTEGTEEPLDESLQELFPVRLDNRSTVLASDLTDEAKRVAVEVCHHFVELSQGDAGEVAVAMWRFGRAIEEIMTPENMNTEELKTFLEEMQKERIENAPSLAKIARARCLSAGKLHALELFRQYHISEGLERAQHRKDFYEVLQKEERAGKQREAIGRIPMSPEKKAILERLIDAADDTMQHKLDWYLQLPYDKLYSLSSLNLATLCQTVLEYFHREIYGLQEVKEAVLTYIFEHFQARSDGLAPPRKILALQGSPGTGKTKFASLIAAALGLPFQKLALGGACDETIITGSRSMWSGSEPSLLLQKVARAGCANPLVLLDEIDKMGGDHGKGRKLNNALLHILDPQQNRDFHDGFLADITHDLSRIWFIATLNCSEVLEPALRDRLQIIEIPDYTQNDCLSILQRHSLRRSLALRALPPDTISFTTEAWTLLYHLVNEATGTKGMRGLEKALEDILSKITLWVGFPEKKMLSYTVPHFKHYPYVVTAETVTALLPRKVTSAISHMYV